MEENMQSRRCRGGAQNTPVTSTYPDNVWIPRPPRHRISTEFVAHDFSNYRHHNFIRTHTRIFRSWHAVTSVLCMFEFSEFFSTGSDYFACDNSTYVVSLPSAINMLRSKYTLGGVL
ncbi:uncharacterized protein [Physcomitrium patens]|uniref:uncharacterized protein n=1 Tax=Physcomitrium patens TaxID=3218 RepID=UPI003CCDB9E6